MMSVIGRANLIDLIRNGVMSVSPIMSEGQIGATSVDLRMGNVLLMVRSRGASHVDPARSRVIAGRALPHEMEIERQQKHERYEIPFRTKFLLHPGTLALVPTLEWIRLPEDIMGTVTARSTWAREGLNIATANFIEPRYCGMVTLELANLGEIPITLYPGLPIAQISFMNVSGYTARRRKGQFELSFEPRQGSIAKKEDFPFLPDET